MNAAKRRYWKAACWETRTCSLGEGSRKSTTSWWQLVGFLSYITYIQLRVECVYLAVLMEVFTRCIRGWHLGRSLDQSLTLRALEQALAHATPEIHHSDQGVQYAATAYTTRLQQATLFPYTTLFRRKSVV